VHMPTAGPIARSGRQSDCVRSHRWGRHGDNQPHQQRPTAAAVMSVGSANGQGPGWESTPPAVRSAAKPTKLWRVQLGLVLVRLSEHPLAVLRPEPPPLVRAVCLCVHPSHRTARPIARSGPLVGPDGGTKAPTSGGAGEIGRESSECRRPVREATAPAGIGAAKRHRRTDKTLGGAIDICGMSITLGKDRLSDVDDDYRQPEKIYTNRGAKIWTFVEASEPYGVTSGVAWAFGYCSAAEGMANGRNPCCVRGSLRRLWISVHFPNDLCKRIHHRATTAASNRQHSKLRKRAPRHIPRVAFFAPGGSHPCRL
jgi:hypothetical protein